MCLLSIPYSISFCPLSLVFRLFLSSVSPSSISTNPFSFCLSPHSIFPSPFPFPFPFILASLPAYFFILLASLLVPIPAYIPHLFPLPPLLLLSYSICNTSSAGPIQADIFNTCTRVRSTDEGILIRSCSQ